MRKRTTTLGVALVGAVVLAGGAYALGAQKDDGSAAADNGPRMGYAYGFGPGPGGPGEPCGPRGPFSEEGLEDFASKLGVSEDQLRAALEKLRPDRGEKRDDLEQALADALGIPVSKVEAAFDELRPKTMRLRPGGPPPSGAYGPPPRLRREFRAPSLATLAKELGVSEDKLRSAFDQVRQQKRDEFAQKLADELGVPVQKVKDALPDKPGP
jgi:lambda repressor-like predicted transcriptional regulator